MRGHSIVCRLSFGHQLSWFRCVLVIISIVSVGAGGCRIVADDGAGGAVSFVKIRSDTSLVDQPREVGQVWD